jgi:hypothetical protein
MFINKSFAEITELMEQAEKQIDPTQGQCARRRYDDTLTSASDLLDDPFNLQLKKSQLRCLRTHPSGYKFWVQDQVYLTM